MTLFQSIFYGLISGFSELLPVSSQANQAIMFRLFGVEAREPLRDLLIHAAILFALFTGCKAMFSRIRREQSISSRGKRRRGNITGSTYELRLIRSATVPLLIVFLIYISTRNLESNMTAIALLLAINGIALIIPEYSRQANKDARSMSGLDGIIMGILGGLSALPGISRIGLISSYALLRGADKQKVVNWSFLLSVPALALMCVLDLLFIFTAGIGSISFIIVCGYIFSAVFAYIGAYFSIMFVRFLAVRTGYSGFAYYCWVTALFSMVLYLIV